jgi:hypothetical protein
VHLNRCWVFPPKCQVCTIELTHHGEVLREFYSLEDVLELDSGSLYLPEAKNKRTLPFYVIRPFKPSEFGDYIIIHHEKLIRIDETNLLTQEQSFFMILKRAV